MAHANQLCEDALIAKVKEHPNLYDVTHKDYKDSRKCIHTWSQIARDIGCPGEWKICKERWRTLRDVYVRNRKSMMVGDTVRKRPRWRFFDQMHFLNSYINHRHQDPEMFALLTSQWVGPEDVETVLCEEENEGSDASETHDDTSNSTSFNTEDLILTTVDGRRIKEEMVEWMDEEIDVADRMVTPDDGDSVTSALSPSAVALSAAHWNTESTPKKRARKLNHLPLDSLPIQIKNVSGSQGQTKKPAVAQDNKKDKDSLLAKVGEHTIRLRSISSIQTQDIKPQMLSIKPECPQDEEEEFFGRYIAAAIKKLSNKSKSLAKMRIQEVLYNLEESDRKSQEVKLKHFQNDKSEKGAA